MTAQKLDLTTITSKYRLLGVPMSATQEQLRLQRNKMMMKFHPDRFPKGWDRDEISPEQRVQNIQSAYRFLSENFDAIQHFLGAIPDYALTQQVNRINRSHWVYSEIESYHKKKL